ncbi:MAG TPA: MarR family winged helix-turn-helix transcriptional regulator [Nitrososphaerales archaeon]|nr:MarR family winged helix-turn-helix transcriptional regulator [Nitrososphaerales archaeon]
MGAKNAAARKARETSPMRAAKPDEVELWRSMAECWKRLKRGAQKNLTRSGLSVAELQILRVLREEGSSPMNRFCAETMLSQPTITGVVDKLEEARLVERVRSREDRREVLIAITPEGNDSFVKGMDLHREFLAKVLSVLQAGEVDAVSLLLKKLADASDAFVNASETTSVE